MHFISVFDYYLIYKVIIVLNKMTYMINISFFCINLGLFDELLECPDYVMNVKKIIHILIYKIYCIIMLYVDEIHQNILYTVIMLIFLIVMVDNLMSNFNNMICIMDENQKIQIVINLDHVQNLLMSYLSCNMLSMMDDVNLKSLVLSFIILLNLFLKMMFGN